MCRVLQPHQDRLLSPSELAERWGLHPKYASRRAKEHNVPKLCFNSRSFGYRLSDILRVELEAEESAA
jgi:hypothetical protein